MFKLLERKSLKVTPTMARKLLSEVPPVESQRPISPSRVDYLRRKMESGEFHEAHICIASNGDGRCYLVNGNHTLRACDAANVGFNATLTKFDCPTKVDVADLYGGFDSSSSVRSQMDYAVFYAKALGTMWCQRVASLLVGAIAMNEASTRELSAPEKCKMLEDYIAEGDFVNAVLTGERGELLTAARHLWRKPVVAAMIRTFQKNRKEAMAFWIAVRDGELLERDEPEYHLHKFLLQNSGKTMSKSLPSVRPHEFLARCIMAWNARRQGIRIARLQYWPTKPVPIAK